MNTMFRAAIVNGEWQLVPMRWPERLNNYWLRFLFRHSKSLAWYWSKKEMRRQLAQARDGPTGTATEIRKDLIKSWAEEWARFGLHSKTWYEMALRGFDWWN
jgi:hypothetical protein